MPLLCHRETCRICDSRDLHHVLSLGKTPPANAFLRKEQLQEPEEKFPLDLFLCGKCGHLQMLDVVSPEVLFRNYVYVSSTSKSFIEHFRFYGEDLVKRFKINRGSLAVEIGSNDGILLKAFKSLGMRVMGVDPAVEIARRAAQEGIETLPEFFTTRVAGEILESHGKASLVAANNVFAHADDLHEILEGVKKLMAPDGIFVFEVSYLVDVYEKTLFDTVYHEHLSYHSVKPLVTLFERHGMEMIEGLRVPTHGGSLRGMVQMKNGPHPKQPSVAELIQLEDALKLAETGTFLRFAGNINCFKVKLKKLLLQRKKEGRRIAGFGAPAKLTTLMHYFEIGPEIVEFVVDDSPLKQNLFTPGYHIPVLPVSRLYESMPDDVLILAWNFSENIIKNHQAFLEKGGHFIIPLPKLEVR